MYGNEAEQWILDQAKESDYYKSHGEFPTHTDTGLISLYSGGFGDMAGVFSGISDVAALGLEGGGGWFGKMLSGQGGGGLLSNVMGGIGAAAGPLSILAMGADWIGGAIGAADEAKKQQEQLRNTIGHLGDSVMSTIQSTDDTLKNLKEQTGMQVQSLGTNLGNAFEKLGDQVKTGWKKTRGLTTGSVEQFKENTVEDLSENFKGQMTNLLKTSEIQQADISQKREEQVSDMNYQIAEMHRQIDDLEDSNDWYENLI